MKKIKFKNKNKFNDLFKTLMISIEERRNINLNE